MSVRRLENLDTDIAPPEAAMAATRAAIGEDEANSWLPFTGRDDLKEAVAAYIERRGGPRYDGRREIVITCGEGDAMLDALFCLTDPGDEVLLTDPTYAGMLNRVRLVGAVPRLVPLQVGDGAWRLDLDALAAAVTERTRVVFLNNASFPSGWVATKEEWEAVASICRGRDTWLLYWAGFEGVLFDGRPIRHPAALPGMRDRTVIVGAPSLEQRMIAWRVGWVVAPGELVNDVARVQIYNGLVPSGFAQIGTRVALSLTDDYLVAANAEYQRRRDETLRQLGGLPVVRPAGAWSLLLDVAGLGLDCVEVSDRLLEQKVAATRMRGWGGEIPIVTSVSCSATSPSTGSRSSARGCARPWRPPATEPDHGVARTNTRGRARGATSHLAASAPNAALRLRESGRVARRRGLRQAREPSASRCLQGPGRGQPDLTAQRAGNHGQSIAYAARLFGVPATVCVPEQANPVKAASMRGLGAELVFHGRDYDEAREHCEQLAKERGYRYVHSGNEPLLIAGVATETLEILQEQPQTDVIIVPIGGGSGAAGASIVAKAISPAIKIIGVQSEAAPAAFRSWQDRRLVVDRMQTVAEGLATRTAFELPQRILWQWLDAFVLVSDDEILRAQTLMIEATRNLVEAAGAAPLAAGLRLREGLAGKRVALILSGGNASRAQLLEVLGRV